MSSAGVYYQHSGRVPPAGLLLALAGSVPLATIPGIVCALLDGYVPIVGVFSIVIAACAGLGAGFVAGVLLKLGKVRNQLVSILVGAAAGTSALYAAWVAWLMILIRRVEAHVSATALATHPAAVLQLASKVNETGAWSIKGFSPSGTFLWVLWAAEAACIVGCAVAVAWASTHEPFCERCDEWCEGDKELVRLGRADKDEAKQRLESGDVAWLATLGRAGAEATEVITVKLQSCPKCDQLHALTAAMVTTTTDSKGKKNESSTTIVQHRLLDRSSADWVRALPQQLKMAV